MDGDIQATGGVIPDGLVECDALAFQERVDKLGPNICFRCDHSYDPPWASYYDTTNGFGKETVVASRIAGKWYIKPE
jgi:hypothetical protein